MYPVLVDLGFIKFYSFGTFIALGALFSGVFLYWAARVRKLRTIHLFDAVLYAILLGLIGARLGYYFIYQEQFQSFLQALYFWQGGLLALSGLFIGFLVFLRYTPKNNGLAWKYLDIAALALLLGWGTGKVGCFMSSCTVGRPTSGFLAMGGAYPVDLLSFIWAFLLLGGLLYVWYQQKLSDGVIFFLSLEGFFLGELLIKTLKSDFGEGLVRAEAFVYLALIVSIYLIFWRLHGPKFERQRLSTTAKNLVFRRRR